MTNFGIEEGEQCWRNGCNGVIELMESDGCCSCHINPPCGYCTTPREYCPKCDWYSKDEDDFVNGYSVKFKKDNPNVYESWKPIPLDPRKIDYRIKPHTNSSQVCEGVYPEGTTQAQIEERVKGTFGGRFEIFGNGKFKYIAYTD